jgi:shikimate dehydrogenase
MLSFAVIGDPIEHSLSPLMHRYFLDKTGVEGEYNRILVRNEDELQDVADQLRDGELDGINITAPWKTAVKRFASDLTSDAKLVGAVNTIKAKDGFLTGHNTDKDGFYRSLQEFIGDELIDHVAVIGAGGAARAVLLAIDEMDISEIAVINRTKENAENLILDLGGGEHIHAMKLEIDTLKAALNDFDLVINTLPAGGRDIFQTVHFPELTGGTIRFYYDLVYSAKHQDEVERAERAGFTSLDGMDMLIYQGIAAMEFWLDRPIESELNMTELRARMRNQ